MIPNSWVDYSTKFSNQNIKAVFSYKSFPSEGVQGRIKLAQAADFTSSSILIPKQTHSTNVIWCTDSGQVENVDGVFTVCSKLVCSIQVADCMPIFFSHESNPIVGIVHAGWRGLVGGILEQSSSLLNQKNIPLDEMEAVIGPSINECCFEVKNDIVNLFDSKYVHLKNEDSFTVNLQEIAAEQLKNSGFKSSKISIINECTYCNETLYHSYRRDGSQAGRMIGMISLN